MLVKNKQELKGIVAAGKVVAVTLKKMREYTKPGITTKELDDYGRSILESFG